MVQVDNDLVLGRRIPVTPFPHRTSERDQTVVDRARRQRQVGGRLLLRVQLLGPEGMQPRRLRGELIPVPLAQEVLTGTGRLLPSGQHTPPDELF